ncbi:MAG: DUF3987 domain-containing protein [Symploca sp. SIO1C4]|uniref:DUF3987 domain-containing protein n=1 Tax=Symploca sp. SIO1C4 TaxID=2607765 RepID=A0A6B3N7P1_9CYAN|nr:DUF3987 domain-containing protein [Symploca sp. SIO1C4]
MTAATAIQEANAPKIKGVPTLWMQQPVAAMRFQGTFNIGLSKEDLQLGIHIICTCGIHTLDGEQTGMSEREVRLRARRLLAEGAEVLVLDGANLPNTGNIATDAHFIYSSALPYEKWLQNLMWKPLTLTDAAALAEDILKCPHLDEVQRSIKLEQLRGRASLSDRQWDKIIKPLQKGTPCGVIQSIATLVDKSTTGAELTEQLNILSQKDAISVREIRTLYEEVLNEKETRLLLKEESKSLSELMATQSSTLALSTFLPPVLANPLSLWSSWMGMQPAVSLLAVLTAVSSLHKAGTKLWINREQVFSVPPTLYSALVAESGQRKSPVINALINKPLAPLEQEQRELYAAKREEYEAQLERWKNNKKQGTPPEEPKPPRLYYFTDATGEAIPVQAATDPEKILFGVIDELAGLFSSHNAYRGGRGSDKQDLLSYFNGFGKKILRASGVRCNLDNIFLSLFGTIQPEILKSHMRDCSDPDGQWARFLFVHQPPSAARLSNGERIDIVGLLTWLYRAIDKLPEMEYHLSYQAGLKFQEVFDELEILRLGCLSPGLRAVYAKAAGYIGRLAINLHVVSEVGQGKLCPDAEIPLETLNLAIQLMAFFVGQAKYFHASFDEDQQEARSLKLIELSKRFEAAGKNEGWVKASDYQKTFNTKKRPNATEARKVMQYTIALGQGSIRGEGCHLEFHWKRGHNEKKNVAPQPSAKSPETKKLSAQSKPQSNTTQGIEENTGFIDRGNSVVPPIPSNNNQPPSLFSLQNLSLPTALGIPAIDRKSINSAPQTVSTTETETSAHLLQQEEKLDDGDADNRHPADAVNKDLVIPVPTTAPHTASAPPDIDISQADLELEQTHQKITVVSVPVQKNSPLQNREENNNATHANNVELIALSLRVAYLQAAWDQHILAGIVGCEDKDTTEHRAQTLNQYGCKKLKIRKAERLEFPYEIVIHDVSIEQLSQLCHLFSNAPHAAQHHLSEGNENQEQETQSDSGEIGTARLIDDKHNNLWLILRTSGNGNRFQVRLPGFTKTKWVRRNQLSELNLY